MAIEQGKYVFLKYDKGKHGISSNKTIGITTADKEVIDEFNKRLPGEIISVTNKPNNKAVYCRTSCVGKFAKELTKLGLLAKGAEFKFIPQECLLSSINYRCELLAGLIDTDGFIDKVGAISYTTKSIQLADDIKNLVFSLGG